MSEWIDITKEKPAYGQPVIVYANGAVQNVTYSLDSDEDCADWFEPHHFDHDDNCKFWARNATHWMPLPEPPK